MMDKVGLNAAYCEQAVIDMMVQESLCYNMFRCFGYIASSGIAGSWGKSTSSLFFKKFPHCSPEWLH